MVIDMNIDWDYSNRARTYDKRAEYSSVAIEQAIGYTGLSPASVVADIGAGTGKLTKLLANYFSKVLAIEPNLNMRQHGQANVNVGHVVWSEGTAEVTRMDPGSVAAVYFGSSFNVVNPELTVKEIARITELGGWFTCLWNHRDTEDVIQSEIEKLIQFHIPNFQYGTRRQDPTKFMESTGIFEDVTFFEDRFEVFMSKSDIVEAWESHETLHRQSGDKFEELVNKISNLIPEEGTAVPYFTRIWVSQIIK